MSPAGPEADPAAPSRVGRPSAARRTCCRPTTSTLQVALDTSADYFARGWDVKVVGVRMPAPGELFVALVTNDNNLPGPNPLFEVVETRLRSFGHRTLPNFFDGEEWNAAANTPQWRYDG